MSKDAKLNIELCNTEEHLKRVYDYDADVFAEAGDFEWSLKNLKKEQKDGWDIYSVTMKTEKEIIAALFLKKEDDKLLTKNTSVKMSHKGMGVSHKIKEFFENRAREQKYSAIVHFCAVDNFRNIGLNESYGYDKVDTRKNGEVLQWEKKI